ncbi:MAG: phosphoglycerate mutase family protein [Hyphomicrobiaceae bacterium]|nr:phosphoglycerate mutase family protein [Hyphomicrobiaceae bacterium]
MSPSAMHGMPVRAARALRRPASRPAPRRRESRSPTTILLVRHAAHDLMDRVLVGRLPGVPLSNEGRQQAQRLARRLARQGITRVHTSPRQRSIETAGIIARAARVPLEISFALDEIDLGAWTGLSFDELSSDRSWNLWNMLRSLARPPDGESMHEVEARIMRYLRHVHAIHPGGRIVLVSHAEVIRAAVMHCQGLSPDAFGDVRIAPAEVVALAVGDDGARMAEAGEAD